MTREEIREDTARTFYEESDVSKTIVWLDLPEETRDSFFRKADSLLYRLQTKHNVVIKVDRELPGFIDMIMGNQESTDYIAGIKDAIERLQQAGYVAIEPLV